MSTETEMQPTGAKLRNILRRAGGKSYELPEGVSTLGGRYFVSCRYWNKSGERLYANAANGADLGYLDIEADGRLCPSSEAHRRLLNAVLALALADPTNQKPKEA